jgi:hypothetical protein
LDLSPIAEKTLVAFYDGTVPALYFSAHCKDERFVIFESAGCHLDCLS